MSVLGSDKGLTVLSHQKYLDNLYSKVSENGRRRSLVFNKEVFAIHEPYKLNRKKAAEINKNEGVIETIKLQRTLANISFELKDLLKCNLCVNPNKDVGKYIYEATAYDADAKFNGGNTSDTTILVKINEIEYVIPPNCRFYNHPVEDITEHLQEKYDLILLDPPWWNKLIRRKRKFNALEGYNMMRNSDLGQIPIGDLINNDGLIAVWCTNAPSHRKEIIETIFAQWGVQFVCQWYWLKVTTAGKIVVPFSGDSGRQPFERIVFGVCQTSASRPYPLPESDHVVLSVPSAIHSHKPPLAEVLRPFLPSNPKCLEVFARYLTPNWTSYGNEVLKFQKVTLFTKT